MSIKSLRFIPIFVTFLGIAWGQSTKQIPVSTQSPLYSSGPVTDYRASIPSDGDVLRIRRSEKYNISSPDSPELGEDSEPILLDLPPTHFKRNEMPLDRSDAVVIGIVTSGQAFLSEDRRNIYSEFEVGLKDVLRTSENSYISTGDSIFVRRQGGSIRLPSGKVLVRGSLIDSMPSIGTRYVLFLQYNADTRDYLLITGYELRKGAVYPLDDFSYEQSHHKELQHPLRELALSEDQFVARVKTMLLQKGIKQ